MSKRELAALRVGGLQLESLGKTRALTRAGTMSEHETSSNNQSGELERLREELDAAKEDLRSKAGEIEELGSLMEITQTELSRVKRLADEYQSECERLGKELEEQEMRAELARLRAIEEIRQEHRSTLAREQDQADRERQRLEEWIRDSKESYAGERRKLLAKIAKYQSRERRPLSVRRSAPVSVVSSSSSSEVSEAGGEASGRGPHGEPEVSGIPGESEETQLTLATQSDRVSQDSGSVGASGAGVMTVSVSSGGLPVSGGNG